MQRYFTDDLTKEQAILKPTDLHHIKHVMRFRVGNAVSVCDTLGHCFEGIFTQIDEQVVVSLTKQLPDNELPLRITIAQALIRRERFEYMIQKATELGMHKLIPINTKYSIVDVDKKKEQKKLERWQKIMQEASEQSRRNIVPKVEEITSLNALELDLYDAVFVAYEEEQHSNTLKTVLGNKTFQNILFVVGPEGGFHKDEINRLKAYPNVFLVGLGKRILRSETAASYFLSVLSYQYEMGEPL